MRTLRNNSGMLVVMAIFALATAPPALALGGGADTTYLSEPVDTVALGTVNLYDGDVTALATSAGGMKLGFAANKPESGDSPLVANVAPEGGGFFGTGTNSMAPTHN